MKIFYRIEIDHQATIDYAIHTASLILSLNYLKGRCVVDTNSPRKMLYG